MATFENTVTIQRPVEDVFAFLADFEYVPTWNYAILETTKRPHRHLLDDVGVAVAAGGLVGRVHLGLHPAGAHRGTKRPPAP